MTTGKDKRSYEYRGHELKGLWVLEDTTTGKTYANYQEYLDDIAKKKKQAAMAKARAAKTTSNKEG